MLTVAKYKPTVTLELSLNLELKAQAHAQLNIYIVNKAYNLSRRVK